MSAKIPSDDEQNEKASQGPLKKLRMALYERWKFTHDTDANPWTQVAVAARCSVAAGREIPRPVISKLEGGHGTSNVSLETTLVLSKAYWLGVEDMGAVLRGELATDAAIKLCEQGNGERYPSRYAFLNMSVRHAFPPDVIGELLKDNRFSEDPGAVYWATRLAELMLDFQRHGGPFAKPDEELARQSAEDEKPRRPHEPVVAQLRGKPKQKTP